MPQMADITRLKKRWMSRKRGHLVLTLKRLAKVKKVR